MDFLKLSDRQLVDLGCQINGGGFGRDPARMNKIAKIDYIMTLDERDVVTKTAIELFGDNGDPAPPAVAAPRVESAVKQDPAPRVPNPLDPPTPEEIAKEKNLSATDDATTFAMNFDEDSLAAANENNSQQEPPPVNQKPEEKATHAPLGAVEAPKTPPRRPRAVAQIRVGDPPAEGQHTADVLPPLTREAALQAVLQDMLGASGLSEEQIREIVREEMTAMFQTITLAVLEHRQTLAST